jgi:RNA polymerase sigma-70 factor (ECF subfamily)
LATGLAKSLAESFPSEPEVAGLVALLSLHDARRRARLDEAGAAVPLPEQDRARWDRQAITQATALLERALAEQRPGPFQVEAAISAVHCRAQHADATDWGEIAALYALLESMRPIPAVRVNRAFAVARASSAAAGLALLDDRSAIDAECYPYVHLVRGALLEELCRIDEARDSLRRALTLARNEVERLQILGRIDRLSTPNLGSK